VERRSLGTHHGRDEFKQSLATTTASFEGMHLTVHDAITSGDQVVLRFTNSSTHVGPFLNRPATGRHAEWLGIGIYTVGDGWITEGWFADDIFGVLVQLGGSPAPAWPARSHPTEPSSSPGAP
jgi:predicted ester cyclase